MVAVYLGSAQMDRTVQEESLHTENTGIDLVFVTPEWMSKEESLHKVSELAKNHRLALVAFDEAHLYHYWIEFRPAYKELKKLKDLCSVCSTDGNYYFCCEKFNTAAIKKSFYHYRIYKST